MKIVSALWFAGAAVVIVLLLSEFKFLLAGVLFVAYIITANDVLRFGYINYLLSREST